MLKECSEELIPGSRIVSDQLDFSAVHIVALKRSKKLHEKLPDRERKIFKNNKNKQEMSHRYLILLVDSLQVIIGGKLH
jgi:hypothetical protein